VPGNGNETRRLINPDQRSRSSQTPKCGENGLPCRAARACSALPACPPRAESWTDQPRGPAWPGLGVPCDDDSNRHPIRFHNSLHRPFDRSVPPSRGSWPTTPRRTRYIPTSRAFGERVVVSWTVVTCVLYCCRVGTCREGVSLPRSQSWYRTRGAVDE
jgi:hypothetical protein